MTYCVAVKLKAGMVFLSDSRTNAGLDQISTFRKMIVYEKPGDHIGWHFDHNFYRGRHFTLLIPVVNQGRDGGLSAART